jgi:hypothetical protein
VSFQKLIESSVEGASGSDSLEDIATGESELTKFFNHVRDMVKKIKLCVDENFIFTDDPVRAESLLRTHRLTGAPFVKFYSRLDLKKKRAHRLAMSQEIQELSMGVFERVNILRNLNRQVQTSLREEAKLQFEEETIAEMTLPLLQLLDESSTGMDESLTTRSVRILRPVKWYAELMVTRLVGHADLKSEMSWSDQGRKLYSNDQG